MNGESNHEPNHESNFHTTDHEVHVTHAEVSHESHEFQEPVALKRNIILEMNETEPQSEGVNISKMKASSVSSSDNEEVSEKAPNGPEADDSTLVADTSESFMKIEEKHVIERLSQVVDTELVLEISRIDDHEEHESEVSGFKVEGVVDDTERVEVSESHDLKNDHSFHETQTNEVRLHAFEDNSVKTENHIVDNESRFESSPRVVSGSFAPEVEVKHNGTKLDVNQNEDEEEDELREIIGFKNKLKLWSSGRPNQSSDSPIDSRNKFKTLRQIKKGNTRSLMEKFQQQK